MNARPLSSGLRRYLPGAEIIRDVPAGLARRMLARELDAALVSSIFCLTRKDILAAPDICIASRGRVASVVLFLSKPVSRIRKVGLDAASLSSSALARIVLAESYGIRPEYVQVDTSAPAPDLDARLQIGDDALARSTCEPGLDLGEEWRKLTGTPFVYALWGIRRDAVNHNLLHGLREAKRDGLGRIASIARAEADRLGLDESLCLDYLTHLITYDLGERELEGLETFARLARAHGLIPREAKLELAR